MSSEEIKQIKETLKYYETTKTEPTYCEELITTGELKRIVEEIERLNNIIKRLETDLYNMYITFGEFSEEYTEKKIRELKGESNEEN